MSHCFRPLGIHAVTGSDRGDTPWMASSAPYRIHGEALGKCVGHAAETIRLELKQFVYDLHARARTTTPATSSCQ